MDKQYTNLINEASMHISKNNFTAALNIIDKILISSPHDLPALRLQAACYFCLNDLVHSIRCNEEILRLAPQDSDAYFNLGFLYSRAKELTRAEQVCLQGLTLNPNSFSGICNLSAIYIEQAAYNKATSVLKNALMKFPEATSQQLLNTLKLLFEHRKEINDTEAIKLFSEKLLAMEPNIPGHYFRMAMFYIENDLPRQAEKFVLLGLKLAPENAFGINVLAEIYLYDNKLKQAEILFSDYLQKNTSATRIIFDNLIKSYQLQNQALKIEKFVLETIAHDETIPKDHAYYKIACAYWFLGEPHKALPYIEQAMSYAPNDLNLAYIRAHILLTMGHYAQGWAAHESRTKIHIDLNSIDAPFWHGEDLNQKTLLICSELGLGDCIQFIRFIKLLKQHYQVTVNFMCPPSLINLFKQIPEIDNIFPITKTPPSCDYKLYLLSLLHYLHIDDTSKFMPEPYLVADPDLIKKWAPFLTTGKKIKIGICWAGNKAHELTKERDCKLEDFLFLKNYDNIAVVSLQKEITDNETELLKSANFINLGPQFNDMADTAAVISQLDVIISVDTAIAHLAGAMGKPVWLLLRYFLDFRHPFTMEKSPWYHDVTFIRQKTPRDWGPVFNQVKQQLESVYHSQWL